MFILIVGVVSFSSFFVMMDENCMYLTQSTLVRGLSKSQFNVLVDVSLKLNDLRNCAVKTTSLVKSSDGKHYKKINYQVLSVDKVLVFVEKIDMLLDLFADL